MSTLTSRLPVWFAGFIFLMTCFLSPPAVMAEQDIPDIILSGLNQYKSDGLEAAVKAWIKGSAVETSMEAISQANVFRQIETMYGKYIGYQLIKFKDITSSSRMVYLTIDYTRGPLFAQFLAYRNGKKWILANFNFNTKAEVILPACFFSQ